MAVATRSRATHRKPAPLSAIVISKENRNRAMAIAGSGVALTMIAGTSGAAVNTSANLDVSASAAHATTAVTVNKEVAANDVAWASDSKVVVESKVADVSVAPVAPAASADNRPVSSFVPPPAAPAGSILATAMQYVGAPYVGGGTSPSGFDCSGFVQYVYGLHGISLPRRSWAQGAAGTRISASAARPGDIVYYGHHVGIYAGNGKMVDAGTPRTGVVYRNIYGHPSFVRIG